MSPGGTPILHATCPRGQCFGLQPTSRTDAFSSLLAFSRVAGNLPRFVLARLRAGVRGSRIGILAARVANAATRLDRLDESPLHSTARLTSQISHACTQQWPGSAGPTRAPPRPPIASSCCLLARSAERPAPGSRVIAARRARVGDGRAAHPSECGKTAGLAGLNLLVGQTPDGGKGGAAYGYH